MVRLYGDVQVIWDVSFEVKKGEIVALIGTNGAGKSTTLKTISAILKPKRGEMFFDGLPIHKMEPYKLIETGIVHVPERRRLFVEMTVEQNVKQTLVVADRAYVLENGRIVCLSGRPA
jgi:branched-chain amino acid transport system ATP-binding protein